MKSYCIMLWLLFAPMALHVSAYGALHDNGDGTVTDSETGLTWQQTPDTTARTWKEVLFYFNGQTEWRLPSRHELQSIIDYEQYDPALDANALPGTNGIFWTSTTSATTDSSAYTVDVTNGIVSTADKDANSYQVWPVSGGAVPVPPETFFTANSDGTVTDNRTGLVWSPVPADLDGTTGADSLNWQQAMTYCTALEFPGQTDWRLPNRHELQSIADYRYYNPAIDTNFFPSTNGVYWTSTTSATSDSFAYQIDFTSGAVGTADKDSSNYQVLAVRSGGTPTPLERYFHLNDGETVTDTQTGLVWRPIPLAAGTISWQDALAEAADLDYAGESDWRLPNRHELQSIVDYRYYSPAVDSNFFPTVNAIFWTSTTSATSASNAYTVDFSTGLVDTSNKGDGYQVLVVRKGIAPLLVTQKRPEISPIDPINPTVRKAVVVVHGWNSTIEEWGFDDENQQGIADRICHDLDSTTTLLTSNSYENQMVLRCKVGEWEVYGLDWSLKAQSGIHVLLPMGNPITAYGEAFDLGVQLGEVLHDRGYEHVHLLAHSAGANLIDMAKNHLKNIAPAIKTHLTFFDAYDPIAQLTCGGQLSEYGKDADYADNYVDIRPLDRLFIGNLDGTKLFMPNAYNVDVTKWDKRDEPLPPAAALFRHEWPYVFYSEWTFMPMTTDMGYQVTAENDNYAPANREKGKACTLSADGILGQPVCESIQTVCDYAQPGEDVRTIGDLDVVIKQITESVTGVIDIYKHPITGILEYWIVETGSPVWANMELELKEPVSVLEFDYEFLSEVGAEGYLTIYFDGEVVGHIDERNISIGIQRSPRFVLGAIGPGDHSLAIRVDPYTKIKSSVKLTNMQLYYLKPTLPQAIMALQVMVGLTPDVFPLVDISGDGKIGLAEVISILQEISQ